MKNDVAKEFLGFKKKSIHKKIDNVKTLWNRGQLSKAEFLKYREIIDIPLVMNGRIYKIPRL